MPLPIAEQDDPEAASGRPLSLIYVEDVARAIVWLISAKNQQVGSREEKVRREERGGREEDYATREEKGRDEGGESRGRGRERAGEGECLRWVSMRQVH